MATSMPASTPMGTAAIYDERVAVVLGFLTLFSLLAVFLSCKYTRRIHIGSCFTANPNSALQAASNFHTK